MRTSQDKFAAAVKLLRESRGHNLAQLAAEIGVNRASLYRYETGTMQPDTGVAFRLLACAVNYPAGNVAVKGLAEFIAERAGISPPAAIIAVLLSSPDAPTLRRIARRAAELLGEGG